MDTMDPRELLRFYADAGYDEPLLEEPVNRFAQPEPRRAPHAETPGGGTPARQADGPGRNGSSPPVTARAAPAAAALPDQAQMARARDLAREARTLDELRAQLESFEGCNLKFTAKQLVFGDGNPHAPLMLVGEAPGRDEDLDGRPFVGRSGRLLDRMLAAIGLDREGAYIANVIPWRPPGNRTPTPLETEICRPFIERQIELVAPRVLVTLGGPSAKILLGTSEGVMRLRGNWKTHTTPTGISIPAMPTLHPAYLLRNPAHKRLAWRDLLEIKPRLQELGEPPQA